MSSCEKLKLPSSSVSRGKNSRGGKLKLSESIASSIGSNINRVGGAQDLTRMLLTDDYFSDVNPRSMRRLMNVVYVTGMYGAVHKINPSLDLIRYLQSKFFSELKF